MRKTLLALSATAMALGTMTAAPAEAKKERRYYTTENGIRYWQGDDGRLYCRKTNGTTGLIVGAAAGALVGRAVDTRGERTTGTVLGAAAGALVGREVDRSRSSRRCR